VDQDTVTGTLGDDVITAPLQDFGDQGLLPTLQTGDSVDGGAGNNVLSAAYPCTPGGDALYVGATLRNIEVLKVELGGPNHVHMQVDGQAGVTALVLDTPGDGRERRSFTLEDAGAGLEQVEVLNASGVITDTFLGFLNTAEATQGETDTLTVSVAKTHLDLYAPGFDVIEVVASGETWMTLGDPAPGVQLKVRGDATTVDVRGGNPVVIDARGLDANAAATIRGGSGDDTLRFQTTVQNVTVAGGDGRDTFVFHGTPAALTGAANATIEGFTTGAAGDTIELAGTGFTAGVWGPKMNISASDLVLHVGNAVPRAAAGSTEAALTLVDVMTASGSATYIAVCDSTDLVMLLGVTGLVGDDAPAFVFTP
jgi:hypothetical protein